MERTKIFLYGLDYAGKTSILSHIKGNPVSEPAPTRAFKIVDMIFKDLEVYFWHTTPFLNVYIWDAPGQLRYRGTWDENLDNTHIIWFVLDVADPSRFPEAKKEFNKILNDERVRSIPLVFCFHKMDLLDKGKNNNKLKQAQESFKLNKINDRNILTLNTSIHQPDSMLKLKDNIVKVVIDIQKLVFKAKDEDLLKK